MEKQQINTSEDNILNILNNYYIELKNIYENIKTINILDTSKYINISNKIKPKLIEIHTINNENEQILKDITNKLKLK